MDVEKKSKKRLDTETKGDIICVLIMVVLWGLVYINDITLESKGIECLLMICAWTVAIFGNRFVKHFTGKLKE